MTTNATRIPTSAKPYWSILHDEFIHVPIELLASRRKSIDPTGPVRAGVLAATDQPEQL